MSTLNATITGTTRNDDGTWTVTVAITDGEHGADFDFTGIDDAELVKLVKRGVVLELKPMARA